MSSLIVAFFHIHLMSSFSTISVLIAYISFIFNITFFFVWPSIAAFFFISLLIFVSLNLLFSFSSIGLTAWEESRSGLFFFTFTPTESSLNCCRRISSDVSLHKLLKRKWWWFFSQLELQRALILAVFMNVDFCSETVCSCGLKSGGDRAITS